MRSGKVHEPRLELRLPKAQPRNMLEYCPRGHWLQHSCTGKKIVLVLCVLPVVICCMSTDVVGIIIVVLDSLDVTAATDSPVATEVSDVVALMAVTLIVLCATVGTNNVWASVVDSVVVLIVSGSFLIVDAVFVSDAVAGNADVTSADAGVVALVDTNNVGASADDSEVLDVLAAVVFPSTASVRGDDSSVIGETIVTVVEPIVTVVSVAGSCVVVVCTVLTVSVEKKIKLV